MTDNPISTAWQTTKKITGSPLGLAALLGLGTYATGRLAWSPLVETFRSLGRPLKGKYNASDDDWDSAMDNLKSDSKLRKWLPAGFGAIAGLTALGMLYNPGQRYGGLLSWNEQYTPNLKMTTPYYGGMTKKESFNDSYTYGNTSLSDNSYMSDIDWNRQLRQDTVNRLFTMDPQINDNAYVRQFGTAIVNNAAIQNHTSRPTLGNIFDSAVDKIENKLSFGGLANVGVKTAIANGLSRMFVGAVGAMTGLPVPAQKKLIDAGTWAGAINAILS